MRRLPPEATRWKPFVPCWRKTMQYEKGERDFVMLQHKFEIENKHGSREVKTSILCEYGDPKGYSAMARLVGIPCGMAVKQVLDCTISERGILAPMNSKINDPLMKELKEKYGIFLPCYKGRLAISPSLLQLVV
ncbi:Saccharopine dehydrogenase-domain-containing protein [Hypoxylon sp. FL0890]|nr:Saccharopine dehydrogenase-domain-containing protein [Hypoxylon sp. FL0890]